MVNNSNRQRSQKQELMAHYIRAAVPEDAEIMIGMAVHAARAGMLPKEILADGYKESLVDAYRNAIKEGMGYRLSYGGKLVLVPNEFWVAVVDEQIVAYVHILGISELKTPGRELQAVVVSDTCRHLGVGRSLVDLFCTLCSGERQVVACKADTTMHAMMLRRQFAVCESLTNGYILLGNSEEIEFRQSLRNIYQSV